MKPVLALLDKIAAAEGEAVATRRGGSKQVTMEQIDQIKTSRRGRPRKQAVQKS